MCGKRGSRRLGSIIALSAAVGLAGCLQPLAPEESQQLQTQSPLVAPPRGIVPVPMPPIITRREGAAAPAEDARAFPEENP
jgi:hypothetical protein